MNLTIRILVGMGAGIALGFAVQLADVSPEHWIRSALVDGVLDAGGDIFVNSLKLMVVPLVFISLLCGAANLGSQGNVGRVGGKTIGLYLLTTAVAIPSIRASTTSNAMGKLITPAAVISVSPMVRKLPTGPFPLFNAIKLLKKRPNRINSSAV